MIKQKLSINPNTKIANIYKQNKVHWFSKFNFINQHNGIRPNKMHLFIAPTHVGKSTLTHSLIIDLIVKNPTAKILLYLTEENANDFEVAISNFAENYEAISNQVTVMVEDKFKSDDEIKEYIETATMHDDFDLLFIDNITTSKLYMDKKTSTQSTIAIWLKSLLEDTTLFIVAHTNGNNYNTELLDETHIRGSKTITNITEFLYVMQPVRINDNLYQFVRVIKHRGQSPENKFFRLHYNKNKRCIDCDVPVSFDDFKDKFKLRNKL